MRKVVLLILSITLLVIGSCGAPLVVRLYFIGGGKSVWLTTWLQSCGWPVILITLLVLYVLRYRSEGVNTKMVFMKVPMFITSLFLGLLVGLGNFSYSIGIESLPVSTVNLIMSTQLAFTAIFAFLIVKQKFTIFSIAAVAFLVVGAASLGIGNGNDKAKSVTTKQYALGFIMTTVSAASIGLGLPLIQFVSVKFKQETNFVLVMEMQTILTFSATIVVTIVMLVDNVFQAIPVEARTYEFGEGNYYLVIASIAIPFQLLSLGNVGVTFSGSALLAGIIAAILLPVTEILAVIVLHEKFTVAKGVSLGFCLLGFALYYYGEIKQSKKSNSENEDASQTLLSENVPTT